MKYSGELEACGEITRNGTTLNHPSSTDMPPNVIIEARRILMPKLTSLVLAEVVARLRKYCLLS